MTMLYKNEMKPVPLLFGGITLLKDPTNCKTVMCRVKKLWGKWD